MARKPTRFTGVYSYTSTRKRYQGKPDVCYYYKYKQGDRNIWAKAGWKSEQVTAALASEMRSEALIKLRHPGSDAAARPRRDITLNTAFEHYQKGLKAGQAYRDRSLFKVHLDRLGSMPLSTIRAADLNTIVNKMEHAGYAAQTVKHVLALVRRIYKAAIRDGRFQGPVPTDRARMPKISNSRWRWLEPYEARHLLCELQTRSETWHYLALFCLHTGARPGEAFTLTGDRVLMDADMIRLTDTKTDQDRTVYMTPELKEIYEGMELKPGRLVVSGRNGPITAVSDTFGRAVDALGLNDGIEDRRGRVVFYSLRHTFGSWLAQAGMDLYTIGTYMGHTDQQTTRRYAHLMPERQSRAATLISERFMEGATPHPKSSQGPGENIRAALSAGT